MFLCCVAPCSTVRVPLDHFEIYTDSNHEKIQRSTYCATRYSAAEDMNSLKEMELKRLEWAMGLTRLNCLL
jgi:hypothetical protein